MKKNVVISFFVLIIFVGVFILFGGTGDFFGKLTGSATTQCPSICSGNDTVVDFAYIDGCQVVHTMNCSEIQGGEGITYVCYNGECVAQQIEEEFCGNGICGTGEDSATCPEDCGIIGNYCGDNTCDNDEDCSTCETDCGSCPVEGNNSEEDNSSEIINNSENVNPEETPNSSSNNLPPVVCGDGTCGISEDKFSCPNDCKQGIKESTSRTIFIILIILIFILIVFIFIMLSKYKERLK